MRSGQELARTTPFPNELFALLPTLRDTEWRLLCVIVRQTWGWTSGKEGERKESDWMTQRQLMARTGRNSEAVSKAINTLVRRNLIEVRDAEGVSLGSPAARRRSGGRLYFSVLVERSRTRTPESEDLRQGIEWVASKTEEAIGKSEVRETNTTKETGTNFIRDGATEHKHTVSVSSIHETVSERDVEHFLRAYNAHLCQHVFEAEPFFVNTIKLIGNEQDIDVARGLLRTYGLKPLLRLAGCFFEERRGLAGGYEVLDFKACIRELLIAEIRKNLRQSGRRQQPKLT